MRFRRWPAGRGRPTPRTRALVGAATLVLLITGATELIRIAPAAAATLTVTNCNDTGVGSLRQMLSSAASGDTITFALSPACSTITLASTITITTSVSIDGPGATVLAVSGNDALRVFLISSGVTVTMSGITVENAHPNAGWGGGIDNTGTLSLSDTILLNNAVGASYGGGIYNTGRLTVSNSTFSSNTATGGYGGGIFNLGTATIDNSILEKNSSATEFGGGIGNEGTLTVTNTMVSENSSAFGGGLWNFEGSMSLANSTVSGNTASGGGGGIANQASTRAASMTVTNSTITGNRATSSGGAIENFGGGSAQATLTLTDSTVSGNGAPVGTGSGIYNSFATFNVGATVISNNPQGGDCLANSGTLTDLGYNLDDDNTCGFSSASPYFDLPNTNPKLGQLRANGGPTSTMALLTGSPAVDHVSESSLCPIADQRGLARTAPCDIGAFDIDGFTITTSSLPVATVNVTYSATLAAIGGNPPYKWSVSSGHLPKGLHLNKVTGIIAGSPNKHDSGTYTFTVKVLDKKIKVKHHPPTQNSATKVLSITIS